MPATTERPSSTTVTPKQRPELNKTSKTTPKEKAKTKQSCTSQSQIDQEDQDEEEVFEVEAILSHRKVRSNGVMITPGAPVLWCVCVICTCTDAVILHNNYLPVKKLRMSVLLCGCFVTCVL